MSEPRSTVRGLAIGAALSLSVGIAALAVQQPERPDDVVVAAVASEPQPLSVKSSTLDLTPEQRSALRYVPPTTTTTTTTAPPPTTSPPRPTTTTAAPTTTTAAPPPPTTTAPAPVRSSGSGDPSDPASWDRLAQCESGGDWHINTGNGYYGGIQFSLSSWRAVGGTGYPHEHSRETQIAMGQRLHAQGGWGHWPGCTRKFGWR